MALPYLAWDPALAAYDFGPGHPLAPIRLLLTFSLLDELGLIGPDRVEVVAPPVADDETIGLVHDADYVAAVRAAAASGTADYARGLGTSDDPVFPGMHEAGARVVGATVAAAQAVWTGAPRHALSLAGGLHHAMPGRASGFCVYNDVAVGIRWLLRAGARRIAYVDLDAHHGDGVEAVFWDDPRVLTISIHQSGRTIFPGTGFAQDSGGESARGSAVNVPLPPGTSDRGWLRAVEAVVVPLVTEFAPDVLVSQHGADAHVRDPLTDLRVSVDAMRYAALTVARLAEREAGGRWLATGGGGYALASVVPRAWAHLVAVASGAPLPPGTPVPQRWRRQVAALGFDPPATMSDGEPVVPPPWEDGYDLADPADRSIQATRAVAFPWHGLEP